MKSLVKSVFENCFVMNGKIKLNQQLSYEQLINVYNYFMNDLLSANIPNIRVIGIRHPWQLEFRESVLVPLQKTKINLLEMVTRLKDVIIQDLGGNDIEKGCFVSIDYPGDAPKECWDVVNVNDNGKNEVYLGPCVLKLSHEQVGSVFIAPEYEEEEANTSRLPYTNCYYENTEIAKVLIPNKHIFKFEPTVVDCCYHLFIKEGTGTMTFEESQKLFRDNSRNIMPCDVTYDLSKYFTCKYPENGDTELQLYYLDNIDEDVLTTILQRYGRRL